jgi:hypothetical protein
MGGTWVDYNLQTTIQVVSLLENQTESRSKQIETSTLMQGLCDGLPFFLYIGDYLSPDIKNGTYLYRFSGLRR